MEGCFFINPICWLAVEEEFNQWLGEMRL